MLKKDIALKLKLGPIQMCILYTALSLILLSCTRQTSPLQAKTSEKENSQSGFTYESYKVESPIGGDLMGFTVYGTTIYYSLVYMSENDKNTSKTEIYAMNTEDESTNLLFKVSDKNIKISELHSGEDHLYWVQTRKTDNQDTQTIVRMDLRDHSIQDIYKSHSSQNSLPMLLDLSDSHLVWYENEPSLQNGPINTLKSLDLATMTIETFKDSIHLMSPYESPYLNGSITSYLKRENNTNSIETYDLSQKKNLTSFTPTTSIINPMGHKNYLVWHDGFRNGHIYILNQKKAPESREALSVLKNEDIDIFSIHLLDDSILISDRASQSIMSYNMETDLYSKVEGEHVRSDMKGSITHGSTTVDGKFIGQQVINDELYFIIVSPRLK